MEETIATIRRMIPDPEGPGQVFTDEELTGYFHDNNDHPKLAVAAVWEALAGMHLLRFKANVRSDDGSVTASPQSELYMRRAKELRAEVANETWLLVGGEC